MVRGRQRNQKTPEQHTHGAAPRGVHGAVPRGVHSAVPRGVHGGVRGFGRACWAPALRPPRRPGRHSPSTASPRKRFIRWSGARSGCTTFTPGQNRRASASLRWSERRAGDEPSPISAASGRTDALATRHPATTSFRPRAFGQSVGLFCSGRRCRWAKRGRRWAGAPHGWCRFRRVPPSWPGVLRTALMFESRAAPTGVP